MPIKTREIVLSDFTEKFIRRFHLHYKKGTPDECWDWQRSRSTNGYGQVQFNRGMFRAHRIAYLIANKAMPASGLVIRHTCDNKICVNPSHLVCGTQADNIHDQIKRGRLAVGSKNGKSKLTSENVVEIRTLYASGKYTHHEIAEIFGVSRKPIYLVLAGKTWKHVA